MNLDKIKDSCLKQGWQKYPDDQDHIFSRIFYNFYVVDKDGNQTPAGYIGTPISAQTNSDDETLKKLILEAKDRTFEELKSNFSEKYPQAVDVLPTNEELPVQFAGRLLRI